MRNNFKLMDLKKGKSFKMLKPEKEIIFDFEKVCDFRAYDTLSFEIYIPNEETVDVTVTIYPLKIARPEFFDSTVAAVSITGSGWKKAEIGFELFDYNKMVGAFWKHISHIGIKYSGEAPSARIKNVCLKNRGILYMHTDVCSKACDISEKAEYEITIENLTDTSVAVKLTQNKYAYESMNTLIVPDKILLKRRETSKIKVVVDIHDNIAPGGFEKQIILAVPNGDVTYKTQLELITLRKLPHPYLLHTEAGWDEVKEKIKNYEWAAKTLRNEYVEPSEKWETPEVSTSGTYVFSAYSQIALRKAVIAWKLTGEKSFEEKAALYLKRLSNPEYGYLATATPYFVFIESYDEYSKGNPKEHRACSAGWVQEAEFFIQMAICYDLLHDTGFLTPEDHKNITDVFRSYIEFMDWLLTDGDGNNFQLAEATAGLYCAMAIQDYYWINRFLYGHNGMCNLMSAVILDDGMYFELATSYMGLGLSLMLETAVACENWGINFKNMYFSAVYDKNILHSPWSMKEKPFLGMSFERFGKNFKNFRSLEQYLDMLVNFLYKNGRMFSCNDSKEYAFHSLYELAYFLYRKPQYAAVIKTSGKRELLFGVPLLPVSVPSIAERSIFADNAGLAVLRSRKIQAVLKYGTHGGYHGHYDRLSLLSVFKDDESFYNCEATWYGYGSFLFKMWVQASLAHNMVVVDQKMQEPTPCERVLFHNGELFQACAAETSARWSDVPYGGQTPYPLKFPQEKCEKENKYVLLANKERKQGDIGEYSEPVFQRRMIIVTDYYVVAVDYLKSSKDHTFDCLYHPEGDYVFNGVAPDYVKYTDRLNQDPFGAGQFITNCNWYETSGLTVLNFTNSSDYEEHENVMRGMSNTNIYLAYPDICGLIIANFPSVNDTFTEEDIELNKGRNSHVRKTVSFRKYGKEARFITILEPYKKENFISNIECKYDHLIINLKNNEKNEISIKDFDSYNTPVIEFTAYMPSGEVKKENV